MKNIRIKLLLIVLIQSAVTFTLVAEEQPLSPAELISFTSETDQLILALVDAAYYLDHYNERCRGYGASMKIDDVSDLIYKKYHARVNDVLQLYRDTNIFRARDAIQRQFYQALGESGGCSAAENNGFEEDLNTRYRQLYKDVEAAP